MAPDRDRHLLHLLPHELESLRLQPVENTAVPESPLVQSRHGRIVTQRHRPRTVERRFEGRCILVTPGPYNSAVPLFKIHSEFQPAGDQPAAIANLATGINRGDKFQTLLGITGSGKSATMAWTIESVQRPTIVIAPNKALAAQLANEFRQFFPENRVEYFVSYYDYYQPEAYLPQTDTYIEKDATVNDEIDRLRHAATSALLVRKDVIIVASVSCIYGSGLARAVPGPTAPAVSQCRVPDEGCRPPADRHRIRAQRGQPHPRQVPGAGRHPRSDAFL